MRIKTENYGLNKPEQIDYYDVEVQNENMDVIDKALTPDFKDYTEANAAIPTAEAALNGIKKGSKVSELFSSIKAFCLNSLTVEKLTTKTSIMTAGQYALDGVEKNPDVEGSLAAKIGILHNNFEEYNQNYHSRTAISSGTISDLIKSKMIEGYNGGDIRLVGFTPSDSYNDHAWGVVHWVRTSDQIAFLQFYIDRESIIVSRSISYYENFDTGWINTSSPTKLSATSLAFTVKPSDMLSDNYSTSNHVVVDSSSAVNAPSNNYPAWYNVVTFGVASRCTQIAYQNYLGQYGGIDNNAIYIRNQHDNNVSTWVRLSTDSYTVNEPAANTSVGSIVSGGYIKNGSIVTINVKINITTEVTSFIPFILGVPEPSTEHALLNAMYTTGLIIDGVYASNGTIQRTSAGTVPVGQLIVSGSYISTS